MAPSASWCASDPCVGDAQNRATMSLTAGMGYRYAVDSPRSWNMGLGRFMMVLLLF